MVSLPTNYSVPFNQGADKIAAGAPSIAFLLINVPKPSTASITPGHGLGLKNASKTLPIRVDENGLNLAGGVTAVKKVYVLTYTGQPTAGQTITLGGKTYEAVASGPTGDQFLIDTDAKTTYDNLVAKVLADTATTLCTGVNSGSGANGTVTFTANTAGTTFAASETLGNATGAETVANVAGVKASILIDIQGSVYTGIPDEIEIPITKNSVTRLIRVQAKALADSSITKQTAAAGTHFTNGLLATLTAAINGSAATDNNRYFSSINTDTETDIADMMEDLFGTASSFTVTGNQLKIEAGATGANGNNIKIITRVLPSVPSPLPSVISNGTPQFAEGVVIHCGIQDESKDSAAISNLVIKGSNGFGDLLNLTGDITDVTSLKLFINNNPEFLRALVINGAVTYDATRDIYMSTNDISARTLGLFISSKAKRVKGGWKARWFYDVTIEGNVEQDNSLRGVAGYTISLKINKDQERSGDPSFVAFDPRTL